MSKNKILSIWQHNLLQELDPTPQQLNIKKQTAIAEMCKTTLATQTI